MYPILSFRPGLIVHSSVRQGIGVTRESSSQGLASGNACMYVSIEDKLVAIGPALARIILCLGLYRQLALAQTLCGYARTLRAHMDDGHM